MAEAYTDRGHIAENRRKSRRRRRRRRRAARAVVEQRGPREARRGNRVMQASGRRLRRAIICACRAIVTQACQPLGRRRGSGVVYTPFLSRFYGIQFYGFCVRAV
jgi:hypothetical protein